MGDQIEDKVMLKSIYTYYNHVYFEHPAWLSDYEYDCRFRVGVKKDKPYPSASIRLVENY